MPWGVMLSTRPRNTRTFGSVVALALGATAQEHARARVTVVDRATVKMAAARPLVSARPSPDLPVGRPRSGCGACRAEGGDEHLPTPNPACRCRRQTGAHPSMRDRARAGDDARIGRIRARDASSIRWIRARTHTSYDVGLRGKFLRLACSHRRRLVVVGVLPHPRRAELLVVERLRSKAGRGARSHVD